MRRRLKTYLTYSIITKALFFSTVSTGEATAEAPLEAVNLVQVLPATGFCSQLENTLSNQFKFKSKFAMERSTAELVDMLRSNKANDYIPAKLLTEDNADTDVWGRGQFYPLSDILGSVLGAKENLIVSFDTADLKHLPFVQQGTHIVLVAKSVAPLNAARAKAVAFSAKRLQIKISIVWYGDKVSDAAALQDGSELAYITALTGGLFVNLGGPVNPCMIASH